MITYESYGYSFRKLRMKHLKISKVRRPLIKNQTVMKVKRLRTDNGLEFCNEAFDNYYVTFGIVR